MKPLVRQLNAWLAWAVVASLLIQMWLAGTAIPQLGGTGSFEDHRNMGYVIGLLSLLLLATAIVARLERRRIGLAAAVFVLYIVQSSLPYMDPALPAVAALHPLNAVLMIGLAFWYARQVWRERAPSVAAA